MKLDLSKEGLTHLVKGVYPDYSVMDDPLIKKSGIYIGGFHDKWEWNSGFENHLTEEELWKMYNKCRDSWK